MKKPSKPQPVRAPQPLPSDELKRVAGGEPPPDPDRYPPHH